MGDAESDAENESKAEVEARRRQAALRALAAESTADAAAADQAPPGAGSGGSAPATSGSGGAGGRTFLYVGLAVVVVLALVVGVVLLSGGDDDEQVTQGTNTDGTTEETTDGTTEEAPDEPTEGTSGSSPEVDLPAPIGDPPPEIEDTADLTVLTEEFLAYRQWALANPAEVDAALIAEPGSPAFVRLVNETGLLEGGERAVVLVEPRFDITSVEQFGTTATFAGTISWRRYSGFDTGTGEVVEERAAGNSNVTGQLVQGPSGWKLTELTVT